MSERITVPATLPGVVRLGTQVLHRGLQGTIVMLAPDCDPLVHLTDLGKLDGADDTTMVDLEDTTGRAHVAWALCKALGLSGQHSPLEFTALDYDPDFSEARCWVISIGGHCDIALEDAEDWGSVVENLSPNDDTRLADGSRRVDALALRAIALHVLGGS